MSLQKMDHDNGKQIIFISLFILIITIYYYYYYYYI